MEYRVIDLIQPLHPIMGDGMYDVMSYTRCISNFAFVPLVYMEQPLALMGSHCKMYTTLALVMPNQNQGATLRWVLTSMMSWDQAVSGPIMQIDALQLLYHLSQAITTAAAQPATTTWSGQMSYVSKTGLVDAVMAWFDAGIKGWRWEDTKLGLSYQADVIHLMYDVVTALKAFAPNDRRNKVDAMLAHLDELAKAWAEQRTLVVMATKLQYALRIAIVDPEYPLCRLRLKREWDDMVAGQESMGL